jgi:Tol biopolymer transport system component
MASGDTCLPAEWQPGSGLAHEEGPMQKRFRLLGLVLLLSALPVGGCAVLPSVQDLLRPPTPTSVVTVTQGQVRDAITKLAVSGAQLHAGTVAALSDVEGTFSIPSLSEDVIHVTAPGYETAEIGPRPGFPLVVDLVPDAATTFAIIYSYEKRHEFGRQYDLLHPDVQLLFSREEFIRYMEQNRPYDILEVSVGAAGMPSAGTALGKVYDSVVQVPVQATVRVEGRVMQRAWLSLAAKVDGLWRWLRGSLIWPTPTPTATSTPLPTATATVAPTRTSTPQPTYTPYPTAVVSPTPYEPIQPGSQAVVIADAAAAHAGPGEQYGVAWGMTRGTVVLVLGWPHWVEGRPWYLVRVVGANLPGWCKGRYLAPLVTTPTPIIQPVTPTPPTAERIAFTSARDGNREIYVMNPDGTGPNNLTQHPAQDGNASWSPLRDRLAFVSDRNGNQDIFLINADGGNLSQVTFHGSDEIHPAWSPSGALIAYVSDEDGDWEIFVMSASGAGMVQLTHNDAWDSYPSWSPDSRKLVFTSDRDGNYELYLYDLETHLETRLTSSPASDAFPAWSPDGTEVAFTSARDGQLELYLLDVTSSPHVATRLTYTAALDGANRYPTWSSDSSWLAFTSWRDGNAEIYIIRRDGLGLWNLTNHPAADESPAWVD